MYFDLYGYVLVKSRETSIHRITAGLLDRAEV